MNDEQRTTNNELASGREVAEANWRTTSAVDFHDWLAWAREQRERVRYAGRCAGGCTDEQIIVTSNGRSVCRHTGQSCKRRELRRVVAQLSVLGRSK